MSSVLRGWSTALFSCPINSSMSDVSSVSCSVCSTKLGFGALPLYNRNDTRHGRMGNGVRCFHIHAVISQVAVL